MKDYGKELLINAVKKLQREGDDYLFTLYRGFQKTEQKPLWWNLYIWYPLYCLMSLFAMYKWTKEFPKLQTSLATFGGVIFGLKTADIKGYETISKIIELIKIEQIDWGWLSILYAIVWYLITLTSLQRKVTNPYSKFFLFQAYRKWDASYKVFGPLVESPEYEKLFEDILLILTEEPVLQVNAQSLKELIESYEEKVKNRNDDLQEKRVLLKNMLDINKKIVEVLVEHDIVHYKHLNLINVPYIVYKKEKRKLQYQWSEGMLQYEKSISLRKKENFFVKIRESKHVYEQGNMIGFWINQRNCEYVLVYKLEEEQPLIKENILLKEEFNVMINVILSKVKTKR